MRIPLLGVALACLAFPLAPLAAQNDGPSNRGRLGIFLNEESDSGGARVRGVVPQGPAAKAGIERGDLIVRFNGTAVSGSQKLVDLSRRLQPGDTVKLEYRRGSETHSASVVADRARPQFAMMFNRMGGPRFEFGAGPDMMFFRSHAHSGLSLVQMSRDLGEYFGTSEGMLVIKPPTDSASPLKAGDVILAIDGRKPQSVGHALKILGSYAPGEKAKLDVMRKKQRTTLTWTAPARPEGHDGHGRPAGRHSMEPGENMESWGAMDFDIPVPSPDDDFMLSLPVPADVQET
jgi:S1-C subfamily serine protease